MSYLRAPWWSIVLTIAGLALCLSAGFWQLGRAAEKRALFEAFAAGSRASTDRQLPADGQAVGRRYAPLALAGRYVPGRQVLLDNMSLRGRPGYQVLTPFQTDAGVVLVNRGWLPADGDRTRLPDVTVGSGERTVTGRIDLLPRPALAMAAPAVDPGAPWPRRALFPTPEDLAAQSGLPLRHFQLLLDPGEPDGYTREWQPATMGPERHLGYAVQWFGLAATIAVIFLVLARREARKT